MNYIIISVKDGDTADTLSREYNTTVKAIYQHNSPQFFKGERLIICNNCGKQYTVMPFDTIESIAKKHNISAQKLAEFNDIKAVFLGQTIIIPGEVDY